MEALIDIVDWYASLFGTFIQIFSMENPTHILPKSALDILVMQELSYNISVGLATGLQQKKKSPWPTLPMWIWLYEIQSFKQANVEVEQMNKYPFDLRSYDSYDQHCIVKDHCT